MARVQVCGRGGGLVGGLAGVPEGRDTTASDRSAVALACSGEDMTTQAGAGKRPGDVSSGAVTITPAIAAEP